MDCTNTQVAIATIIVDVYKKNLLNEKFYTGNQKEDILGVLEREFNIERVDHIENLIDFLL